VSRRLLFLLVVTLGGCAAPAPVPDRLVLYEQGKRQVLTGHGRVLRIHYDGNGDRRVDVVTILDEAGGVARVESDINLDGKMDRWEEVLPGAHLGKRASSRTDSGKPDAWSYLDESGSTILQEFDDDGDGRVDRVEGGQGEPREARDTDGDGRPDRWLVRSVGREVAEELDTDGDGRPDRRLIRGAGGEVVLVEADPDGDGVWEAPVRR
jgi:hypothetical protein